MGRGKGGEEAAPQVSRSSGATGASSASDSAAGAGPEVGGFSGVNDFLTEKFGLDKKEKLALLGTALAAPIAALAGPLVGVGLAVGLAAPHLHRKFEEAKDLGSDQEEMESAKEVSERLAEAVSESEALVQEAERRAQEAEGRLEEVIEEARGLEEARMQEVRAAVEARLQAKEESLEARERLVDANEENAELRSRLEGQHEPRFDADGREASEALDATATGGEVAATGFDRGAFLESRRESRADVPHAMMPMDPHWSEHVLRGDTKFEFRKGNIRQLEPGARVVIYTKAPVKAITGYFDVEDVYTGTPEEVWDQVEGMEGFNFTEREFFGHCGKAKSVTSAKIGNVQRLAAPASTDDLGFKGTDLQGIKYLHPQASKRHESVMEILDNRDADLAEVSGGELPAGFGSETPPSLLAAALKSKAKAEKKTGAPLSALASS